MVKKIKDTLSADDRSLVNKILNGNIDENIKQLIEKMILKNKKLLEYLSPKNWAKNINDIETTQKIFNHRSKMNSLSSISKWNEGLEKAS